MNTSDVDSLYDAVKEQKLNDKLDMIDALRLSQPHSKETIGAANRELQNIVFEINVLRGLQEPIPILNFSRKT